MTQTLDGLTQLSSLGASSLNALGEQKYQILKLIEQGEVHQAKTLLDILHPLWNTLGYGYKGRELYRDIRDRARTLIAEEQDYLSKIRKNDRTRRSTEARVAGLEVLAASC